MADYGSVRGKGGNSGAGGRRKRVVGETSLRAILRGLPDDLAEPIKKEIREAAEIVHFDALRNIPNEHNSLYATGELSSRFRIQIDKGGFRARVGTFGRTRVPYAHLVEFGTAAGPRKDRYGNTYQHPGTRARPFLQPAYERNRVQSFARIKAAVVRALEAASRGNGVLSGVSASDTSVTQTDVASLTGDSL